VSDYFTYFTISDTHFQIALTHFSEHVAAFGWVPFIDR